VEEVKHRIVDGNPSKQTVPDSQVYCNEAIATMRIVQPHLNSYFTQTHSENNTYPSPLPNNISLRAEQRCNTDRGKSQPGWGPGSKTSPVSNGVLRDMAIPCFNYRLTRASQISARADFSPSPQLVGPIMESTNITKKTKLRDGNSQKTHG